MRYSFVLAALSAGAVLAAVQPVSQISDGQVQAQVQPSAPAVTAAPVAPAEQTVKLTKSVVVTSCGPEVKSCPGSSYASAPASTPNVG